MLKRFIREYSVLRQVLHRGIIHVLLTQLSGFVQFSYWCSPGGSAECVHRCTLLASSLSIRHLSNLKRREGGFIKAGTFISNISGPDVIKLFPCSTQLSMKFFLLINVKMPTIVGILTILSRKNNILGLQSSR